MIPNLILPPSDRPRRSPPGRDPRPARHAQVATLGIATTSTGGSTASFVEKASPGTGCINRIFLQRSPSSLNQPVALIAFTVDGPDRLRNYGVPAYLADGSAAIRSRSQFSQTIGTGRTAVATEHQICVGNDQPVSPIRTLLLPAPGCRVDPDHRSIDILVADLDACDAPDDQTANGRVVDQFNGSGSTCICAAARRNANVRRLVGPDPVVIAEPSTTPSNPMGNDEERQRAIKDDAVNCRNANCNRTFCTEQRQSEMTHQTSLRRLGEDFHDPGHLYCPKSPWKGLP